MDWAFALHGRSGLGMSGAAPLSYSTIEAWARLMDIGKLEPYEVEALIYLDTAFLTEEETAKDEQVKLPSSTPRWPSKKGS